MNERIDEPFIKDAAVRALILSNLENATDEAEKAEREAKIKEQADQLEEANQQLEETKSKK